jgi:glycosyltransferase involved in cell wall biosynthesis
MVPAKAGAIRVLYLQPGPLFGGAERQAATLMPLLEDHGLGMVPLVGPGQHVLRWFEARRVEGLTYSADFPGGWEKPRGLARLALPARYVACARRIARTVDRLIVEQAIDLVVAAQPFSWVVATPVARRHGLPVLWRAGGTEFADWHGQALKIWAGSRYLPDVLVACGSAVADRFAPYVRAPIEVIPNGVDQEEFHPLVGGGHRYRPPGARLVVAFAGRLVPQKRLQDFLEMAARLAPRFPGARFLVAGEGSQRETYERMVAGSAARSSVQFLGYVADMRSFYDACDIFTLPSRSEGCPNVVLETMAMRKALVVSDAAGTREVIDPGYQGLVYPIGDVDAFTRAVESLLTNPAGRQDLGVAALARVTERHGAVQAASRWASLIRRLCAARSLARPARAEASSPASAPEVGQPARGPWPVPAAG